MASFQLIETRLISGVGLIRFPTEPYRSLIIYAQVVRPPQQSYGNFAWKPTKALFARITNCNDDYVLSDASMEYEQQMFVYTADISSQVLKAVQCAYKGTLQSFVNIIPCFGGSCFPTNVTDLVAPMEPLPFLQNRVIFSCFTTTAIELRLFGLRHITCGDEEDNQPPPPPPPARRSTLPPNQPIADITPPYDAEDDITEPNPIDEISDLPDIPDFPVGNPCSIWRVTGSITSRQAGLIERSDLFYGEITEFKFNSSQDSGDGKESITIGSRGLVEFNGFPQPCGSPRVEIFIQVDAEDFVSFELTSVELESDV